MEATPDLKQRLIALGLGILVLTVVYSFVIFVSPSLRFVYAIGAILLLCMAMVMGTKGRGDWLNAALLCVPLVAVFSLLVLPRFAVLWPHLLLWFIAAMIGSRFLRVARVHPFLSIGGATVFVAVSLWYCARYIPEQMARSRSDFQNVAAPTFTFQPVSDPLPPMAGRVLVIDFFATTCGPCIAELPELTRVREELRDKNDIEFILVASDAGGDTPERFKSFAQARHITLPLGYDPGGKAHAAFGLVGVPALVILDRTAHVRLTQSGYNPSNFRSDLVRFLKTL